MKELTINCRFPNGSTSPVKFFVGNPSSDSHPIQFQSQWLQKEFGGKVPDQLMTALQELNEMAKKSKLNFEDLCQYVFDEVNEVRLINSERARLNKQVKNIAKIDKIAKNKIESHEE